MPNTSELIKGAKALIDAVTFDVNGINGKGGNGGLTSNETIRKADELRLTISRFDEAQERARKAETRPDLRNCPFCDADGSNDELVYFQEIVPRFHSGPCVTGYSIFCAGCGVELHDEYEDDLVNRWNGVKPAADDQEGSE